LSLGLLMSANTIAPDGAIGVLWAQYGPYHLARVSALAKLAGPTPVYALELANRSRDYLWTRPDSAINVITLCPGSVAEQLDFKTVFRQTRAKLQELGIQVCFLPSYSPLSSAAALLAAKSLGIRTVMMNESHAGTARATGVSAFAKRRLIRLFDAALVGGSPQQRYFAALGLPEEKIFTGYDAVDNDYFARGASQARARAEEYREHYELPGRFFLSLGRFVPKKNLASLILGYRCFLDASMSKRTHLVLVGSGEEEARLRALCVELHLPVCDHPVPSQAAERKSRAPGSAALPAVHFYGFRQIEENPIFYGLADAFVLPSLEEEWGLVVNEAMAANLPVVVSETAGCAEDLLESGWPRIPDSSASEVHHALGRTRAWIRKNGFLFDPRSAQTLAGALLALESSTSLRAAMGSASGRIAEKFSCGNFAENALRAAHAAMNFPRKILEVPRPNFQTS
jgi:1,2-diacylglycerol 3-alpha-glucosyltransferase